MFNRKNKYQAVKVNGFHSKLESAVYDLLCLREKAGEISDIQCQVSVYLTDARILYIPDFKFFDMRTGTPAFAEAKGFESERWPTIKKLWKFYGPAPLEIWKGTYKAPVLVETIRR